MTIHSLPCTVNTVSYRPHSVAIDAACLYITDFDNDSIHIYSNTSYCYCHLHTIEREISIDSSRIRMRLGRCFNRDEDNDSDDDSENENENEDEDEQQYRMKGPTGICVDDAHLYVCDSHNHCILIIDKRTYRVVRCIDSEAGATLSCHHFLYPSFITVDHDTVYLTCNSPDSILLFHKHTCTFIRSIGCNGTGNGELLAVRGVAVTATSIVVADSGNRRIQIFDKDTYEWKRTLHANVNGDQAEQQAVLSLDSVAAYCDRYVDARIKLLVVDERHQRLLVVELDDYEFIPILNALSALWQQI